MCGLDGCKFVAHPKVILKHVQMQQHTGLYKKIGNLYSPEDIAKWIAERKRQESYVLPFVVCSGVSKCVKQEIIDLLFCGVTECVKRKKTNGGLLVS